MALLLSQVYAPYMEDEDNRLSQLCQAQIFFALLSSIALKYDADTRTNSTNIAILLSVLTILPMALAFLFETPLFDLVTSREQRSAALEKLATLQSRTSRLASVLQRSRSKSLRSQTKPSESATSSNEHATTAAALAAESEELAAPSTSASEVQLSEAEVSASLGSGRVEARTLNLGRSTLGNGPELPTTPADVRADTAQLAPRAQADGSEVANETCNEIDAEAGFVPVD